MVLMSLISGGDVIARPVTEAVFSAQVAVTDGGTLWHSRVVVHAAGLEHQFEKSYAKSGWTAAQAGDEALLVVVDRVGRGVI